MGPTFLSFLLVMTHCRLIKQISDQYYKKQWEVFVTEGKMSNNESSQKRKSAAL